MENTFNGENSVKDAVESKVLYDTEKSPTEIIRISKGEYKGKGFIDLRIFFKDKETGEFRPTKKGFTLKPDVFRSFVEIVSLAEKELN